jgi:hypothetical protein
MMGEIIHLPKRELTTEQEQYWYERLEVAQRMAEYAMRMLGLIEEKGVNNES